MNGPSPIVEWLIVAVFVVLVLRQALAAARRARTTKLREPPVSGAVAPAPPRRPPRAERSPAPRARSSKPVAPPVPTAAAARVRAGRSRLRDAIVTMTVLGPPRSDAPW